MSVDTVVLILLSTFIMNAANTTPCWIPLIRTFTILNDIVILITSDSNEDFAITILEAGARNILHFDSPLSDNIRIS